MSTTHPPLAADPMSHGSSRLSPQHLLKALEQRDGALLAAHSLRWAHRHGVEALESLIQGQALDETARLWWREQLLRPTPEAVANEARSGSQPAGAATISVATEPLLTAPAPEDTLPLPAEWLVPSALEQQAQPAPEAEPQLEPPAAVDDGESGQVEDMDVAAVEPAASELVGIEAAAPEPPVVSATEPLPPLAEAFGPIPDLEPLPSFNVQAIFAMQSELAEKPLAPPIVPPVMAPPPELQLEAFPPLEAQSQPESLTQLQPETPTEPIAGPADPASEETVSEKPSGQRRNPFSRLRGLLKDCVEEVASTFGNEQEESPLQSHSPMEPGFSRDGTPWPRDDQAGPQAFTPSEPLLDAFPAQPPAPRGPIAPPPFALQQPPQASRQTRRGRGESGSSAGRGARTNRPATPSPAPSHPALDSLRSWLPDSLEQDDHRQAS
ncbi:hypothetical protein I1E95_03310 [Synechococcus sp. CBW1107]|uniref:hypothetical protein n=1 Tax=Synechococcus sp. CBW1107 TaxID=2789857 RepID=UPI0018CE9D42|nr:hypothetical protein [Synechococcus sp. CBW1107]QPN57190.1 hypothetical protein I1E95_03310 [Synechococcus sp. CBW1107]